jgi:hypothetical protein
MRMSDDDTVGSQTAQCAPIAGDVSRRRRQASQGVCSLRVADHRCHNLYVVSFTKSTEQFVEIGLYTAGLRWEAHGKERYTHVLLLSSLRGNMSLSLSSTEIIPAERLTGQRRNILGKRRLRGDIMGFCWVA